MKIRKILMSATIVGLAVVSQPTISLAYPGMGAAKVETKAKLNQFWRPDQLDLAPLRDHDAKSNPYGENFDYATEFKKLDMAALKKDISSFLNSVA